MAPLRHQPRHRLEQALGIGMLRRLEDGFGRADLDNAAEIHDRNPVRHMAHHRQLMSDQQHADAGMVL